MADADLRELQRRAAAGEPGARGASLLARRRVGELNDEALGLAAHVGDVDARQVLGWPDDPQLQDPLSSWSKTKRWETNRRAAWAGEVAGWGEEAAVRTGIALVRLELRTRASTKVIRRATPERVGLRLTDGFSTTLDLEVEALIGSTTIDEAWRGVEETFASRLPDAYHGNSDAALLDAVEQWALCPCEAHLARATRRPAPRRGVPESIVALARSGPELAKRATGLHRSYPVTAAVRDEVAPWALGERDPVRDRLRPAPES